MCICVCIRPYIYVYRCMHTSKGRWHTNGAQNLPKWSNNCTTLVGKIITEINVISVIIIPQFYHCFCGTQIGPNRSKSGGEGRESPIYILIYSKIFQYISLYAPIGTLWVQVGTIMAPFGSYWGDLGAHLCRYAHHLYFFHYAISLLVTFRDIRVPDKAQRRPNVRQ